MMELHTDRLILREFVADDWPAVLAYQSDPRYLRLYEWTARSEADVRAFVQLFIDQQQQRPRTRYQLAITLKADGRLIGNCGIRVVAARNPVSPEERNRVFTANDQAAADKNPVSGAHEAARAHDADIGYELAPDAWGHGYATEAARAIVRFGFETLGLHRISADTVADNTASARVLQKLGLTLEGRLRDKLYYKGRYWDVVLFGMIRPDQA
ncbi:GCN5-related N-acetyltransferase [Candidatus Promineifilum breve]|uniref:GCN5-related N-acetyltransferase n=1 Tax=Candidatus Promineifilum breve TaxID=1806508 RepID=A0A160TA50_9CHLR|nr:GNAT family protein [Candidatus Promineifilum breve]CUS06195.1 GCN5-related N-acetyltransferase [Candidatus Promineifilum breve]